jgi:ubiquinone/menaquinone biosynthesis C-methylase UbiE
MITLSSCPVCSDSNLSAHAKNAAQMHPIKEVFNFDRCNNCGVVFINPRLSQKDLNVYYTSHYLPYRGADAWGKYAKIVKKSQLKLDKKRVELLKKHAEISTNSLILDVGCGKPTFLNACKEAFNCNTLGIDFSNYGWINSQYQFKDIALKVIKVEQLNQAISPDVITMWHYLEHDDQPLERLKHLAKISKPSTTLIIEVPNYESKSRKKFGKYWAGWHTPRHLTLFSPDNMNVLLERSGWEIKSIKTHGTLDPYLLYWMSKMEQKGLDWKKELEDEFWEFVLGMLLFFPKKWNQKNSSLGIMTAIAQPKKT